MDFAIMSRDTVVAQWINNELIVKNENLLPLFFKRTADVNAWLEARAIDSHRANSRLLKKALRLTEKDDTGIVLSVNAVCITDTYWVKPLESSLRYSDVVFDNDYFSNLALKGNYDSFNRAASGNTSKTPELTNVGSFEKCWKLIGGEWWMYKTANHNEQFSELFTYELGLALGMNMAVYQRGDKFVKSKDFTNGAAVNFEPAYGFMGQNEDYIDNVKVLQALSPKLTGDYVKMIFLDTLVANPDRHTFNYGILRDTNNGDILGMAPNFDNNMALIARGYPQNIARKKDILIQVLNELLNFDESLKQHLPRLPEEILRNCLERLNMKVKSQFIIDFIMNGYRQIEL